LEVKTDDLRGTRILFWHPWTGSKEALISQLVKDFNAANKYDIFVEVSSHGGDLFQDVRRAIGVGTLPNISVGFNYQISTWDTYQDTVVDINPYLSDPTWGFKPGEGGDFYPLYLEQDIANGKLLGLPAYRSAEAIYYNQSWAHELGFTAPPASASEFKEQACAAAADNNDGTGGWIAYPAGTSLLNWIFAFGGEINRPELDGYSFSSPESSAAFAFIRSLFNSGCAWIPENRYANEAFAARQGLFYTSSMAGLPYQIAVFEDSANQDEWAMIPFPGPEGESAIDVYGQSYVIFNSTPEEQLAAWLLAQWLTLPANQAQWIQESGYMATRASTVDYLEEYIIEHPQWIATQDWASLASYEPLYPSWGIARWAIDDAAWMLFSSDFNSEDIPKLLDDLDATMAEIHVLSH
jgi:ABC-type glycerol-3-phosphate transport system substrate-binding protein